MERKRGCIISKHYWLFKSEPDSFGIDALAARPKKTTAWDGVRNYQARNMLRDSIKKGDSAFFYHSSCAQPGIAGTIDVVRGGYPDVTAESPLWFVVDVKLLRKFKRVITLDELRAHGAKELQDFVLLRRGNRLSVMPVTKQEWDFILALE